MPIHADTVSSPIRAVTGVAVALALVAFVLVSPAGAHPHGPSADEFTFIGGGWGHGVGMSQYGALSRGEAGHTHAEILAFYYEGTELTTDASLVPDDIDVRIGVHNSSVFRPSGTLTVSMDGRFLDTTQNTLTIRRGSGGWHINSSNIDWCRGFCSGTMLTVDFNEGETVRVSGVANGTERYAYGQFQLTPASTGATNCGSAGSSQYCLVIGEMTMQQYLRGIAEMPSNWPTETLKAQAIAARSYAVAKIGERVGWSSPFDLYTSTTDQEYRGWDHESDDKPDGFWASAVAETDDSVLVYTDPETGDAEVVFAFYTSSNGGFTATEAEFDAAELPYIVAKPDPFDAALDADGEAQNPFHAWERTYTTAQVSEWLADYPFADLDVGEIQDVHIAAAGPSGRINDAKVTLVGSERTLEVLDDEGEPWGYRFYNALRIGCRDAGDCRLPLSTQMMLLNAHGADGYSVYTLPFSDVHFGSPYVDAVVWMLNRGVTQGTSATAFSPNKTLTRAQFATFLWRYAGEPEAAPGSDTFSDAELDSFYDRAVGWMVAQGITGGCSDEDPGLFCPESTITEAQAITLLWRFAGRTYSNHAIPFTDIGVNDYFLEASRWAIEHGIWVDDDYALSDGSSVEFGPSREVSRARLSVLMWNLAAQPSAFKNPDPSLLREG